MSVQLDWEIDDVETPLPNTTLQSRRRLQGCRRWWHLFVLVALAVAVGLGFLGFEIRQKQKELEAELRAVIELELNALSNGDRDLFLSRQDPSDRRWQRTQEEVFNQHRWRAEQAPWENTPQVREYTGEVPVLHVQEGADKGWAQVEVKRGERTWQELWFYEWTQDDGWHHVRFDKDWLGEEQALSTSHLHFTYPQRDAVVVTALADEMEAWYDILAPLFGVRPTSATVLTVRFTYRAPRTAPFESYWVGSGSTLEAPSIHQGPLGADSIPTPELRGIMAGHLAEALIAHQTGQHSSDRFGPTVNALRAELRDWAVAQLASASSEQMYPDVSPTPLIDALVAREGAQILPALVESLNQRLTLDQALAAASLAPPDPVTRMAFHVAAANRAFHDLDETSYRSLLDPQADRSWRQDQTNRLLRQQQSAQAGHLWPAPSSLQIKAVVLNGPIAWVETEVTMNDDAVYRRTYFFRQVNRQAGNDWLLTTPDRVYFGERRVTRTENLVFNYFERDAEWFEDKLPAELQAVFSQAAADLGISAAGLVITVATEIQLGSGGPLSEDENAMLVTSPSIAGWRVDQPGDQVLQMAVELLGLLFQTRMRMSPAEDERYVVAHVGAFLWEIERLFPEQIEWDTWLGFGVKYVPVAPLVDLWAKPTSDLDEGNLQRALVGYRALFEFLVETYGLEVVPPLLDNLSKTDDLDEWLRLSTGQGLEEIEPAWQAWVSADY